MSASILTLVGIVVALVVIAGWAVAAYNGLINKRMTTRNSWSQIDVQLKRRYDLIPNIVATVKGYAAHERDTLKRVTEARNLAVEAHGVAEQARAENMLTGALKSLFAVTEAYPDLKANQNFLQLQEELTATENRIGFARQNYNDVVAQYNSAVQSVPTNIVANTFGFKPSEFFVLAPGEASEVQNRVAVSF